MTEEKVSPRSVMEDMRAQEGTASILQHEIAEASSEHAVIKMIVRPNMVNGYNIAHGGMIFTLADTAIAYAACANGALHVTANASINFLNPAMQGDILSATARVTIRTGRSASVDVIVENKDTVIATGNAIARQIRQLPQIKTPQAKSNAGDDPGNKFENRNKD